MIDPEGWKIARERDLLEQLAELRGAQVAAVLYYPVPLPIVGAVVIDKEAPPRALAFVRHIHAAASDFK